MKIIIFLFTFCCAISIVGAQDIQFDDSAQEKKYKQLISELRCLVCQNQNLADSSADLAKDLRAKTYALVKEGASEAEVLDYMVNRYGDFVLYRPRFRMSTLLLWIGPFIFLLIGVVVIIGLVRRQRKRPSVVLSPEDRKRAHQLLQKE